MDEYVAFYMEWIVEQSMKRKVQEPQVPAGVRGKALPLPFVLLRQIQLFGENCLRDEPENRIDGGFNR